MKTTKSRSSCEIKYINCSYSLLDKVTGFCNLIGGLINSCNMSTIVVIVMEGLKGIGRTVLLSVCRRFLL